MPKKTKVLKRKKKTRSLVPVVGSEREYLLKQQSLRLLVDKRMSIANVAFTLKTTPVTIKSFLSDPTFVKELDGRMDRIHGQDKGQRIDQMKISLYHLQEEMRRREAVGELKESSNRDIHKMIIDTQKELRLDTPGEVTSKVGVADLGRLQDRFHSSLSGKLSRMGKITKKRKKMKRVNRDAVSEEGYAEDQSSVG